ncbi:MULTISPECIES: hypothetical protein [Thermomonosporaceae]|uniref:hypothetical protein n=1 Tax=Thermomonosporaceae TaxID=2012 RepID=UPI00255AD39D|nr:MULTISPECIES: hypothetical protein [Thermomonosporaceae]MDL4774816.1 hypothetical protein [Actinomadura xylanilytica]
MKFAQCMRQNGVDVPDPGSGGAGQTMRLGGKGTDRAALQAAMKKCQPYLQAGGKMPDMKDPKVRDQYIKFAQCMRKNGVDMPDPKPDGGMALPAQAGDRAKVEKAGKACKGVLAGAGGR